VRRTVRFGVVAVAALAALAVRADIYTWTDASGRVQLSDRPPKNFSGPVKRIETNEAPPAVPVASEKPAVSEKPPKQEAAASGKSAVADKRRAERERLQGDLDAAREKLSAAQKALAEGQDQHPDEQQIVQRPAADPKRSPMPGLVQAGTRSNCRQFEREGKKYTTCPVSMPNEAYFARVGKLEEAVKAAEEELAAAERAYRRGVD
jgi:hypothetical protein